MIAPIPAGYPAEKGARFFWMADFFDLSLPRNILSSGRRPFCTDSRYVIYFKRLSQASARLHLSEFRSLPIVCRDFPCADATACGREFSKCRFLKFCACEKSTIALVRLSSCCAHTG